MNLAKFAVTRPVAVTMRVAALVVLGLISLLRLPVDLLPRIDIPIVAISVSRPNTSPEEMETQITRPLEQAVSSVRGLYMISSNSNQGSSFVRVQFEYGTDIDQAAVEILQLVQRAQGRFPQDPNISPPQVFKFDPSTQAIVMYGVTVKDKDLIKLRTRIINEIGPQIESAGGVASINIAGGQDRAIMVEIDPEKLKSRNLAIADIANRLAQENLALPAGTAIQGKTQYSLRSIGYFKSIDDIKRMPLGEYGGSVVTLQEVATIRDAHQDILSYSRLNGEPALIVSATKQKDANTIDTTHRIDNMLREIEKRSPDIKFTKVFDQARFIEKSIADLKETAIIGAVLAILIITFFLRNLKSTLVVALSIPISIISTFTLLYFFGYTLNSISLAGLALASGLIVDDAIVVLENIYRHIERDHENPHDAAIVGTKEILSAVVASTMTIMVVFVPLLLIKGQTGQIFTQFALVIIFSLAVSLLDATSIVPMLVARMKHENPETKKEGALSRWAGRVLDNLDDTYRRGLQWTLRKRNALFFIGALSFGLAWLIWPMVGQENFPPSDSGSLNVRVRLPNGTPVTTTDPIMKQVEAILMKDPDVELVAAGAGMNVGLRGGGGGSPNDGSATVLLKSTKKLPTTEVIKRLQKATAGVPGARVQISPLDIVQQVLGNSTGFGIDVYGSDWDQLTAAARQLQRALSDVPGLQNVDLNVQENLPEIQWSIDRQKAAMLGVSFNDVASTISSSTSGRLATFYQDKGFQYPVYVQIPREKRQTVEQLENLPITSRNGSTILLGQVAAASYGMGPNQIARQNRQRVIGVGGNLQDRTEGEVQKDAIAALKKVELPQGVYWSMGQQQIQKERDYAGLGMAVFLAILLIYMLLAAQFESFIYPLVVLFSVPLCAIGLVLGLFITGRSFSMTAFIGLLMLVGISVKNGILLVDYTNQLRERGMPRDEALLTAGPTRLRPILMTTLCAIIGMLPLALGLGAGSELYVPLATAVIGGLTTSTVLTLYVIPAVYTLFDDWMEKRGFHMAKRSENPEVEG